MPTDYGTDVYCNGDLRPNMPEVSGRTLLIYDLRNRLETAPGTLSWDPLGADYGYDLRALVASKQRSLTGITGRIAAEVMKDERVDSASCSASWESETQIRVGIEIDDGDGPFSMTLLVSSLTVDLLTKGA